MRPVKKDIFISCRYDGSGNQFASRLSQDLQNLGFGVYYDVDEIYSHSFPDTIRKAVEDCKDFILIISSGCLERFIRNDPVDWVREEVLTARSLDKPIIPILMENISFPEDAGVLPEPLRFLPTIPAIKFPVNYTQSPISLLVSRLNAGQDGSEAYKDVFNSNPRYRVSEEYHRLLDLARAGDVKAMYELGMMGFYGVTDAEGTGSPWDYEQAAYWLKKVADTDDDLRYHAQSTLARMYYQGVVPREPQSYEKAYALHCAAAEGDEFSSGYKAFLLRVGVGCEFDLQTVVDYHRSDLRQKDDFLVMELAKFLTKYGRFQEALELYESMEILLPEAAYQMGLLFKDGVLSDPPRPDYFQAAYYFRDAADNHHIQAAYEYGLLCFRPSGRFRKDFQKAEKYLKKAADAGHDDAQYILGYMYRYGHLKRDLPRAIKYLEKARTAGHCNAIVELAFIYQQPECRNYQRAYECAKEAASKGTVEAEMILGNLLFFGRGCEPDMNKAYEMYSRAKQHGMYYAGVMMEKIDRILRSGGGYC